MKIQQEKETFKPICIVLETREEAKDFIGIIDNIEHNRTRTTPQSFSAKEVEMIINISNSFTENEVVI